MNWKCSTCEQELADTPICFGFEAPWHDLVPESEFSERVDLTKDRCVVDKKAFFIRGHIEISIHGQPEPLSFAVWSSLSEKSFLHMSDRWIDQDRANDLPYFGWLSSSIPAYPDTINLKLSVQSRAPGLVPLFNVEPSDHPLSIDQQHGIGVQRWHELVHSLQHGG